MTITDINKILSQLAANPSRENVLDFAFTLLQWMNIEANKDNKPQLLSPQTQKLKDFLATAPQTVQPQLYRISADNQNIRVRFAVLKKLKKDYISQLVDNDPGLSSYQSFIKGLTSQNSAIGGTGSTGFIPTQAYFIHFVTTPDYDKLVVIFNQGEQKRIVSFRNRLTNTQYNKIILAWQGIGTKSKPEIADLLWKSLDIKEVNKEFYRQIKERFDALLGIVKTQHAEIALGTGSTATDNQIKQFTVRLIGRYIFCWFLKEKGIISQSLIGKSTIAATENYYQQVLLKLFFETLNTKVQDRNQLRLNKLFEKIPYLNGGLFDESEEDKLFTKLDLDKWLLPFVEILESYDFTVDESSSQYQQVAVDPEMLGRIFENLLASQNEETEKLANQRKAFGAFYTPREIVDYMVNESIKAYLQTQWEQHITEEKSKQKSNPQPTENLFGEKKPQQLTLEVKRYELKPDEKQKIEKAIEPLFAANPDAATLKKDDKNLLLKFLEQIKILDPACGSGAFPMGVLHKLVELHEALGTVKSSYELKKDILSQNIYGVDIMPMAIEIARLRAWLSLVLEENYNAKDPVHNFGVKPLPNLDFKFVCANSLIDLGLDAFIQESKGTLHEGFSEKLVKQLKDLEDLRKQFFTPALASTEKEKLKAEYFEKRNKVVADIEADSDTVLKAIGKKIQNWNPFDDSKPSNFFSPTWMFGIDKGFDVVIGNPPYVNISNLKPDNYREYLKSIFYSAKNKTDLYAFFIEAFSQRLKENGSLIFIVPHTWKATDSFSKLREILFTKAKVNTIVNLEMGVFEAIVKPLIIHLTKAIDKNYSINVLNENFKKISSIPIDEVLRNGSLSLDTTSNDSQKNLFEKIELNSSQLENFIQFSRGIKTSDDKRFVKQQKVNSDCKPVYRGKNIKAYKLNWNNEYVWYRPDLMKEKVGSVSYTEEFFKVPEKIVTQRVNSSSELLVAYDNEQNFFLDTVNVSRYETWNRETSLKFLCGVLNSKLINFWYCNKYKMPTIGIYELNTIPMKTVSKQQQKQIEKLVDEILKRKKANQDTTALEKEIDVLVYKLYELTYEEVKIIDKDFWLSEEEYEKVKVS